MLLWGILTCISYSYWGYPNHQVTIKAGWTILLLTLCHCRIERMIYGAINRERNTNQVSVAGRKEESWYKFLLLEIFLCFHELRVMEILGSGLCSRCAINARLQDGHVLRLHLKKKKKSSHNCILWGTWSCLSASGILGALLVEQPLRRLRSMPPGDHRGQLHLLQFQLGSHER